MKEILQVNGMNCAHCEQKIRSFVSEVKGVKDIKIDLNTKQVIVEFDLPADISQIKEAILDSGFEID